MGRRPQENPALDMTPMIDVVFELIIFFVVTLTESQKTDETIELEDGTNGIVLTPEELPPTHMQIDVAIRDTKGNRLRHARISMADREISTSELQRRVEDKKKRIGEFPILIRADYDTPHSEIAKVMNACTSAGIWKISFMAIYEDRTSEKTPSRPHLDKWKRRK